MTTYIIPYESEPLIKASKVKSKPLKQDLGTWKGLPIIAIGKYGGKIVGYDSKGKPIYTSSSQAQKLSDIQKQEGMDKIDSVGEWLLALGIPNQIKGSGVNVQPASAELLSEHFGIKGKKVGGGYRFSFNEVADHIGEPLVPNEEDKEGWGASMASGELEEDPFPDLSTLKEIPAGEFYGSHGNLLFEDPSGQRWVFKGKDPTIARAEEASARIGRLLMGELIPAARVVTIGNKTGALIKVVPGEPLNATSHSNPPSAMLSKHRKAIAQHYVADWLTSNHDGHAGNFLEHGKKLFGIDKGQAWKFFGKDKLDKDYSPNPSNPIYNKFWNAVQDGTIDPSTLIDAMGDVVSAAEKVSPDQYRAIIAPYVSTAAGQFHFAPDPRADAMVERLKTLRTDVEAFLSKLLGKSVKLPKKHADNFETMPEVEGVSGQKLTIEVPDKPKTIKEGPKEAIVTEQVPGWPATKGKVTINHPGAPSPGGKWGKGYPGVGFSASITYKKQNYAVEFVEVDGELKADVYYPDGTKRTWPSPNAASESMALYAKGLPFTLSSTEKKKEGVSLPAKKFFGLQAFKEELMKAHAGELTPAQMNPKELEEAKVIPENAPELSVEAMIGKLPDGLIDWDELPHGVKETLLANDYDIGHNYPAAIPPGVAYKATESGLPVIYVALKPDEYGAVRYQAFDWESGQMVATDMLSASVDATHNLDTHAGLQSLKKDLLHDVPQTADEKIGAAPKAEIPKEAEVPPEAPKEYAGPLPPGASHTVQKKFPWGKKKVMLVVGDDGETFQTVVPDEGDKFHVETWKSISAASDHVWVKTKGYADAEAYKKATGKTKIPSGGGWGFWGLKTKPKPAPSEEVPKTPEGKPGLESLDKFPSKEEINAYPVGTVLIWQKNGMVKAKKESKNIWTLYPPGQPPEDTVGSLLAMETDATGVKVKIPAVEPAPPGEPGWDDIDEAPSAMALQADPVGTKYSWTKAGETYNAEKTGPNSWKAVKATGTMDYDASAMTMKLFYADSIKVKSPEPAPPVEAAPGPAAVTTVKVTDAEEALDIMKGLKLGEKFSWAEDYGTYQVVRESGGKYTLYNFEDDDVIPNISIQGAAHSIDFETATDFKVHPAISTEEPKEPEPAPMVLGAPPPIEGYPDPLEGLPTKWSDLTVDVSLQLLKNQVPGTQLKVDNTIWVKTDTAGLWKNTATGVSEVLGEFHKITQGKSVQIRSLDHDKYLEQEKAPAVPTMPPAIEGYADPLEGLPTKWSTPDFKMTTQWLQNNAPEGTQLKFADEIWVKNAKGEWDNTNNYAEVATSKQMSLILEDQTVEWRVLDPDAFDVQQKDPAAVTIPPPIKPDKPPEAPAAPAAAGETKEVEGTASAIGKTLEEMPVGAVFSWLEQGYEYTLEKTGPGQYEFTNVNSGVGEINLDIGGALDDIDIEDSYNHKVTMPAAPTPSEPNWETMPTGKTKEQYIDMLGTMLDGTKFVAEFGEQKYKAKKTGLDTYEFYKPHKDPDEVTTSQLANFLSVADDISYQGPAAPAPAAPPVAKDIPIKEEALEEALSGMKPGDKLTWWEEGNPFQITVNEFGGYDGLSLSDDFKFMHDQKLSVALSKFDMLHANGAKLIPAGAEPEAPPVEEPAAGMVTKEIEADFDAVTDAIDGMAPGDTFVWKEGEDLWKMTMNENGSYKGVKVSTGMIFDDNMSVIEAAGYVDLTYAKDIKLTSKEPEVPAAVPSEANWETMPAYDFDTQVLKYMEKLPIGTQFKWTSPTTGKDWTGIKTTGTSYSLTSPSGKVLPKSENGMAIWLLGSEGVEVLKPGAPVAAPTPKDIPIEAEALKEAIQSLKPGDKFTWWEKGEQFQITANEYGGYTGTNLDDNHIFMSDGSLTSAVAKVDMELADDATLIPAGVEPEAPPVEEPAAEPSWQDVAKPPSIFDLASYPIGTKIQFFNDVMHVVDQAVKKTEGTWKLDQGGGVLFSSEIKDLLTKKSTNLKVSVNHKLWLVPPGAEAPEVTEVAPGKLTETLNGMKPGDAIVWDEPPNNKFKVTKKPDGSFMGVNVNAGNKIGDNLSAYYVVNDLIDVEEAKNLKLVPAGADINAKPKPKPKPKPVAPPKSQEQIAEEKKAKAVNDWAKNYPPVTDHKVLHYLAYLQKQYQAYDKKMTAWARMDGDHVLLGSDHPLFAKFVENLNEEKPFDFEWVDTPLGKMVKAKPEAMASSLYGDPAGMMTGPDGKTYPNGTTFKEKKTKFTKQQLVEKDPSFYKFKPHATDPDTMVVKVAGTGDEQKKALMEMLVKAKVPFTGDKEGMPIVGGQNVLAFVKKSDLAAHGKTETSTEAKIPPQPKSFQAKPLPYVMAPTGYKDLMTPDQIKAIPGMVLPRMGRAIAMGKPGVFRDNHLKVRRVKGPDGVVYTEFYGTLAQTKKLTAEKGWKSGYVNIPSAVNIDSHLTDFGLHNYDWATGLSIEKSGTDPTYTESGYNNTTDGGSTIAIHRGSKCTKNMFRIRVADGSDIEKELTDAFEKLGHKKKDVFAPVDAKTERIWKKWALVRAAIGPLGWRKEIMTTKVKETWDEKWLDEQLAKVPKAQERLDAMVLKETFQGHPTWIVPTDVATFRDAGWKFAMRSDGNWKSIYFQLSQGAGWASQLVKGQAGSFKMAQSNGGQSAAEDIVTGGADTAFFRAKKDWSEAPSSSGTVVHPRAFLRTDWRRYNTDAYGNITGEGTKAHAADNAPGRYNDITEAGTECVFQGGVPISDVMCSIVGTSEQKTKLMNELKKDGINEINGVPLEDFILVGNHDLPNRIHPSLRPGPEWGEDWE